MNLLNIMPKGKNNNLCKATHTAKHSRDLIQSMLHIPSGRLVNEHIKQWAFLPPPISRDAFGHVSWAELHKPRARAKTTENNISTCAMFYLCIATVNLCREPCSLQLYSSNDCFIIYLQFSWMHRKYMCTCFPFSSRWPLLAKVSPFMDSLLQEPWRPHPAHARSFGRLGTVWMSWLRSWDAILVPMLCRWFTLMALLNTQNICS